MGNVGGKETTEEGKIAYGKYVSILQFAKEQIQSLKNDRRLLKNELNNLSRQQKVKKMAIDARIVQIHECERIAQQYTDEINSTSDLKRVTELVQQIQEKQSEISSLNYEISYLKREITHIDEQKNHTTEKIQVLQEKLNELLKKCKFSAKFLSTQARKVRTAASAMESEARKLLNISTTYRFGSNMAGTVSGFRSNDAREANQVSNGLDKLASEFHKLAQSEVQDREHEIEH